MFNVATLTSLQNGLLSIGIVIVFLVGVWLGITGKIDEFEGKFKWIVKFKKYAFWVGIGLCVGVFIWNVIDGTIKF